MLWLYFWFHLVFIISPHTQEIRQQPYPEQGGPPPRPIKHAINEQNNTDHHVLSSMFVFSLTPSASVNKPKILTFSFLSVSPSGPECSRNFTSSGGVIKVTGFPEKYPNNLDCTFMILLPRCRRSFWSSRALSWSQTRSRPLECSAATTPPGDLGRLPWRWVIGEICWSKRENLNVWNKDHLVDNV